MTKHKYTIFEPFLSEADAESMVRLCERFGTYGTYSEEPTFAGIGDGLPARWDAVRNFLRNHERAGRSEPMEKLAARTNYFRETFAYGNDAKIEGIEPFLHHEGFIAAAKELHGRPVIEPAIVFANLLVPGQELAVHTDVPEFRGISRKTHPQWMIVAMHHSGMFNDWRMPIATGVSWFHDCRGGEFAFYPNGPDQPPVAHPVRYNTAVLLDTDSVFHGVEQVAETEVPVENLSIGMKLQFEGDGVWKLTEGERLIARHRWADLRFSISWKAYCFANEKERQAWFEHRDDLSVEHVVDRFVDDLRSHGKIQGDPPPNHELVDMIIDEYIHYPEPPAA